MKMGCEFSINISKSMPKSEQACLKLVKPGFSIFNLEKSGLPRSRALVTSCVESCVLCQGVVLVDKLWKE